MHVVRAPQVYENSNTDLKCVFMAGGISGCPPWQTDFVEKMQGVDGVLFDPRRTDFDVSNPSMSEAQIAWEHDHLRQAHAVSFWFPEETLCPITLFELGVWSSSDKKIFVGTHPGYKRRFDVVMQLRLSRPEVYVVRSLDDLLSQVKEWVGNG